jgi:hypothetical protein
MNILFDWAPKLMAFFIADPKVEYQKLMAEGKNLIFSLE